MGLESSFALEQAVGACESHLYQKEGLQARVKQSPMELLFGLPSTRIKSRVSIPVYFVSLLGFEVTEVVALNRIDLPWLDKPSDLGINSGRNSFLFQPFLCCASSFSFFGDPSPALLNENRPFVRP